MLGINLNFKMRWHDHRLEHPKHCVDPEDPVPYFLDRERLSSFWTPSLEIGNVLSLKEVAALHDATDVVWENSGDFEIGGKYDLCLTCQMDFGRFPFDEQTCHVDLSIGKIKS